MSVSKRPEFIFDKDKKIRLPGRQSPEGRHDLRTEPTDDPDQGQGAAEKGSGGSQGDRMVDLLFRQRKAVYSLAMIEGDPIEPDEPDPKVVRDTKALFDDPREAFDDIKLDLLAELERGLAGIERRLDTALKIRAAVRRQSFRLLGGGEVVSVTVTEKIKVTKNVTEKRGCKPIGRKAMTPAERQAKRRAKLREEARKALIAFRQAQGVGTCQPPHGYAKAKQTLQMEGRVFERARRDWGFEDGVFVDGAFISSHEVIRLADTAPADVDRVLADRRRDTKSFAIDAVLAFAAGMRVSLKDLQERIPPKTDHSAALPAPYTVGRQDVAKAGLA